MQWDRWSAKVLAKRIISDPDQFKGTEKGNVGVLSDR